MTKTVGKLSFANSKENIIGKGSKGTIVFKGFYYKDPATLGGDEENKKQVAIKRMQKLLLKNDEISGNHEVELMQKAEKHENILRCICFEKDEEFV